MSIKKTMGLVFLIVMVSASVYIYLDYQESIRQQKAFELWEQEIERQQQEIKRRQLAWDEEVYYYQNLTARALPGHGGLIHAIINDKYEYGRWNSYLSYVKRGIILEIRNVTRMELRHDVNVYIQYMHEGQAITNAILAEEGREPLKWTMSFSINIDESEGVIFIRRVYLEVLGEKPFAIPGRGMASILVCWRP